MKKNMLTVLENSKNYTISVAEAMPESEYNNKLIEESWKFNELLTHIGYSIIWWDSNVIRKIETNWEPPVAPNTKEAVIQYLEACYKSLKSTLENIKITDDIIAGFNSTFDHTTHHRAQAIMFLRQNNIVPPEYVY